VTSIVSAATLAKSLSGIDLPQSKENIIKYIKKNRVKISKDMDQDILEIFKRLPKKDYKDMADIEKELSKILYVYVTDFFLFE
jgi:hypothetical protein